MTPINGWETYQKLVLHELERQNLEIEKVNEKLDDLKTAVTMLQVKAGVTGAIGGAVLGGLAGLLFRFAAG